MVLLFFFDRRALVLAAWLMLIATAGSEVQGQTIDVEFLGSNVPYTNSDYDNGAFMCLINTNATGASTEECFGFYKSTGTKGFIGGPALSGSFLRHPRRINGGVSVRKRIDTNIRQGVIRLVNNWNAANNDFTNASSIDFIATVVSEIGWRLPQRDPAEFPQAYLNKTRHENVLKPSIPGVWSGQMEMGARVIRFSIQFQLNNGVLSGQLMIDPNNQGPCDNLEIKVDRSVSFSVGEDNQRMNFTGSLEPNIRSMTGNFTSSFGNGTWRISKTSIDLRRLFL